MSPMNQGAETRPRILAGRPPSVRSADSRPRRFVANLIVSRALDVERGLLLVPG